MLPLDARRTRRNGRTGPRPGLAALERLEDRQLLSFSPLGFSLPDIAITGYAAPVAAWGGPFAVVADVSNHGASSLDEPLNLQPGSPSTADTGPFTVDVFFQKSMRPNTSRVLIGTIQVADIPQNSSVRFKSTFTLPAQPPGFRANGNVFVSFVADPTNQVLENDKTNNAFLVKQPVHLVPPLPDLEIVGLDVPPVMQPGDTIRPNIEVANFGAVDSSTQGPFTVTLLAISKHGASTLANYTVEFLPPLSVVPQQNAVLGDASLDPPVNVETLDSPPGPAVTLPLSPKNYIITAVADPLHRIQQIRTVARVLGTFTPPVFANVGPRIRHLPPDNIVFQPSSPGTNPFPFPAFPVNTTGATPLAPAAIQAVSNGTAIHNPNFPNP